MIRLWQHYRKAFTGMSRETWLLSFVMLINRCGSMVLPFMTLYLTQVKKFTIAEAGWVITFFGLGAVCGGLAGGWFSDRIGFYYVQISALFFGGCMFFVLGEMNTFTHLCTFAFILAFINDAFRPANAAAIGHYSKKGTLTRSFSLNRLSINIGWALGGALGGFLAAKNYHLLFWIDGSTNIAAAGLLWLFLSPKKMNKTINKDQPQVSPSRSWPVYKDLGYLLFIVCTTLFAICFFQIFSTLPVYYRDGLRLSETQIGLLMGLNGLIVALLEMVVVHALDGKKPLLRLIAVGTLLMAFSFVVFNLWPSGGIFVALFSILLLTFGEMLSMPFMNTFWVHRAPDGSRGKYAGLFSMAWAIAQVAGPAGGSQVAYHFGYSTLWWVTFGLCTLTALAYWGLHKMGDKMNRQELS